MTRNEGKRIVPFCPIDRSLADEVHGHGASWILGLEGLVSSRCYFLEDGRKGLLCLGAGRIYSQRKTPKQSWFIFLVFPMLHTRCRDAKLAHSALTLQWAAVGWRTAGGHENARKRCLKSFCKPCRACLTAQLVRVDEGRGALTGRGF